MDGRAVAAWRASSCVPNGSHLALYDDQQVYMAGLIGFLKDVDAGRF